MFKNLRMTFFKFFCRTAKSVSTKIGYLDFDGFSFKTGVYFAGQGMGPNLKEKGAKSNYTAPGLKSTGLGGEQYNWRRRHTLR